MSWCWLALTPGPPEGADASAAVTDREGVPAGWLAVWFGRRKPLREARRIDARIVDPAGAAATVSLVRPPDGVRLPFRRPRRAGSAPGRAERSAAGRGLDAVE